MRRETLGIYGVPEEREELEARLVAVERAYAELLDRVRRYERERVDIRERLNRILARIGPSRTRLP